MPRLKLQHVNKRGPWYLNFIRSFQLFWLNNTWQSSLTAHISNEILSNTRSQIMNRYGIEWKKWLPFSRQYFQMRFLQWKCWLGAGHVTSHFLNQCWPWFMTSQKHDDIIKWKHFLRNCSFVQGIHWSSVNSPHKGQWRGALTFSLICAWINGWVNYCDAVDLRCHCTHYDVTVMMFWAPHGKGNLLLTLLNIQCGIDFKDTNVMVNTIPHQGPISMYRLSFPGMGIPMLKIRRSVRPSYL